VRRDDAGGDDPAADVVNGASLLHTGRDLGPSARRKVCATDAGATEVSFGHPPFSSCHESILRNTGPATLSEDGKACLTARRLETALLLLQSAVQGEMLYHACLRLPTFASSRKFDGNHAISWDCGRETDCIVQFLAATC
jgi:hypothetical protein